MGLWAVLGEHSLFSYFLPIADEGLDINSACVTISRQLPPAASQCDTDSCQLPAVRATLTPVGNNPIPFGTFLTHMYNMHCHSCLLALTELLTYHSNHAYVPSRILTNGLYTFKLCFTLYTNPVVCSKK